MVVKLRGALFGAALLLGACGEAVEPAAQASAEAEASILAVLSAQTEAWNQGDIPVFMEGYWEDEALRFASGNAVRSGFEETINRYLATYDTPEKMGTLSFRDLDVQILGDDAALVFGRFYLERPEEGDATGLFTLLFRKIDGAWLIVHDHTSS